MMKTYRIATRNLIIAVMTAIMLIPSAQAQDLPQFKRIVKQLSSAKYQGRGYARDGVRKAGSYIAREFEKAGADNVSHSRAM